VLLQDHFGEKDKRLAYPSLLLFLVQHGQVLYCRLIPLRRGTVEEVFLQLQSLLSLLATGIAAWKGTSGSDVKTLWENLKAKLLEADYTVYIQNSPRNVEGAITSLKNFMPPPEGDPKGTG
jgi:hypothetical protein